MKGFNKVVREIRRTVIEVLVIPSLLDGILLFLIVYLLLALFELYPLFAIIPAAIYTVFIMWRESKINTLKLVEKYYPNLHEKLRTAADYANVDDIMVNELHTEVLQDVRNVAASTFISRRKILAKVVCCIIISFVILSITHFDISAVDYKAKLQDKINDIKNQILLKDDANVLRLGNQSAAVGSGVGGGVNRDIFGKKHLATLGDEELQVELKPSTLEFKVGKVEEAEKKEFEETFPSEVFLTSSASYEENIPKDQQEIVKNYFKKVSES
ncbi:hypothetical protein HY488_00980 [Candidatus Woesearchaeota archaeon]|nr:hypothetical protein [Candidatus Woesearchaeota archaeon]